MARTQSAIDRKLQNKVDRALAGTSCRGPLSLIEMLYAEIVRTAAEILLMKDAGIDKSDSHYASQVGTLDGLVWSYCFCWVNAYPPHFAKACTRVRRQAIKDARIRVEAFYERESDTHHENPPLVAPR